jgi:hypothetical protein
MFTSLWFTVVVVYVAGMLIIGYPMARHSLKIFKDPERFSFFQRFLFFPVCECELVTENAIKKQKGYIKHSFLLGQDVYDSLHSDGDGAPIARYIILTMLCWPLRTSWLLLFQILVVIGLTLTTSMENLSRVLGWVSNLLAKKCPKCLQID